MPRPVIYKRYALRISTFTGDTERTMYASETAKGTLVTGMDIIVLLTSDPERQIAFYRDVRRGHSEE
jgi:hypothetical protein